MGLFDFLKFGKSSNSSTTTKRVAYRAQKYPIVCPCCFKVTEDPDDVEFRISKISVELKKSTSAAVNPNLSKAKAVDTSSSDSDFDIEETTTVEFNEEEIVDSEFEDDWEGAYYNAEDLKLNEYFKKMRFPLKGEIAPAVRREHVSSQSWIIEDQVIIGIIDRKGNETRTRLCPYCHNDLPNSAGRAPSNIISIIGASQVGKSVYMTMLIDTLQRVTAQNFNASCLHINKEIGERFKRDFLHPIKKTGQALAATQLEHQPPLIYELEFKNERGQIDKTRPPLLLVFFDIAGEAMKDPEYLEFEARHITNSKGLLFLIDPLQFSSIRDIIKLNVNTEKEDFTKVEEDNVDIVVNLRQVFRGGKSETPTAIVMTKSDMLKKIASHESEYIRDNSNIFSSFQHRNVLNLNEFYNIDGEVKRFIDRVDPQFKSAVDVTFLDTAYFAVSALGKNPEKGEIKGEPNPIRIDEPFLWLLYKLGYIAGGDE
jgi:hypothetical protein